MLGFFGVIEEEGYIDRGFHHFPAVAVMGYTAV